MQNLQDEADIARKYLAKVADIAERKFDEHLPPETDVPKNLHKAMRYSVFAGGKRLRPGLAHAAFELFRVGRKHLVCDQRA